MTVLISRVNGSNTLDVQDQLAIEEPLEIKLAFLHNGTRVMKNISVTMRTPGADTGLATGFLFTEGIISGAGDIMDIRTACNSVTIVLKDHVEFEPEKLDRNFYTTSSCGVCGKSSIAAVITHRTSIETDRFSIRRSLLGQLPGLMKIKQEQFNMTGGIHASALVNSKGKIIAVSEDVGRHNALDKLIGNKLMEGHTTLSEYMLLLSGRASFELMQKAYMAGIPFVAAIGAPSSLAVQFASEKNITLVGFLRKESFNIYHGTQRISESQ